MVNLPHHLRNLGSKLEIVGYPAGQVKAILGCPTMFQITMATGRVLISCTEFEIHTYYLSSLWNFNSSVFFQAVALNLTQILMVYQIWKMHRQPQHKVK